MVIFIPTRGRFHKQLTRRNLFLDKMNSLYHVIYVVPQCEAKQWKERTPHLIIVPDDFGFSEIRQYIMEHYTADDQHIVIDDDFKLSVRDSKSVRGNPTNPKLRSPATFEDVQRCFRWVQDQFAQGWVHGGFQLRSLNFLKPYRYSDTIENYRENGFHFYRADVVRAEEFNFRDIPAKQDFHFTLSMLELGYPNIVNFQFAIDQLTSGTAGGCSRYRTHEMLDESSRTLARLHPGVVKVIKKDTVHSFGGGTRTDVRCAWKRSFQKREGERKFNG